MRWVARCGLVELAELHLDALIAARDWPEVSLVGVSANPDRRTLRDASTLRGRQPLVEALGAAPHVGVRVARHLESATRVKR